MSLKTQSLIESVISSHSQSDFESMSEMESEDCCSSKESVDLVKAKILTKFICKLGTDAKAALYKDHHEYLKNYDTINELKHIQKKPLKSRTWEDEKTLQEYFEKVPFVKNLKIDKDERRELCNLFRFEVF